MSKTTTLHVHHAFLYISLPSLHDYDVKWPNFKFTWELARQGDKFYHLCPNWARSPFFSSSQNPLFLSNRANWDNHEKFKMMRSLFSSDVFMDVAVVGSKGP